MRYSRAFVPTLKGTPANARVRSHSYMVRGVFICQLAAGIYNLLPRGWRVVHKIDVSAEAANRAMYAANVEQAEVLAPGEPGIIAGEGSTELTVGDTPGARTIEQVTGYLKITPQKLIKTLAYLADDNVVLALVRGDRAVNEVALKKRLGATGAGATRTGGMTQ